MKKMKMGEDEKKNATKFDKIFFDDAKYIFK